MAGGNRGLERIRERGYSKQAEPEWRPGQCNEHVVGHPAPISSNFLQGLTWSTHGLRKNFGLS